MLLAAFGAAVLSSTASPGRAAVLGAAAFGTAAAIATAHVRKQQTYPYTRRDEHAFDTYKSAAHGTVHVKTPYHWLEHPEAPEVQKWVSLQNEVTAKYLSSHTDIKDKALAELTKLNNFEKIGVPSRRGNRFFHYYNTGLQNHSVLKMQEGSLDAPVETLLDPNTLSEDGTVSLGATRVSDCGAYLAYAVNKSGSDWSQISVKNVATKEDLAEKLDWVKFSSITWTKDSSGFFYARYPPPQSLANQAAADKGTETDAASGHMLYFHKVNTPQSEDRLICKARDESQKEWMFGAEVTDCGRWAVISVSNGCDPVNQVWLLDMHAQNPATVAANHEFNIVTVVGDFAAGYDFVGNDEHTFYFKTNFGAPRYKLIAMDVCASQPQPEQWTTLVPEHVRDVLSWVHLGGGKVPQLVCCHEKDVKNVLTVRALASPDAVSTIEHPHGTIGSFFGRREDDDFFFALTTFTTPSTIYHVKFGSAPRVWKRVTAGDIQPEDFDVKQVFYTSKDGAHIPMYIISRAGAKLDSNAPTMLYGYGGFNISLMPAFAVSRLLWVQKFNGVYAIANLRGGGEYGEEWHKHGSLLEKQNVFDDFQAAAEYLIAQKYTCAAKLGIQGGSNGGLLVAACINQRPDLFGAAIGQVGVMDMLKFHRFTIGYAWKSDYGDPDSPEYFDYLRAYSPLHNVNAAAAYPATLLTTADHDDRVVPNHSYKLIAELQYRLGEAAHQSAPLLIKIEEKAGHGAGKPLSKQLEETAANFSFLAKALGAVWQ